MHLPPSLGERRGNAHQFRLSCSPSDAGRGGEWIRPSLMRAGLQGREDELRRCSGHREAGRLCGHKRRRLRTRSRVTERKEKRRRAAREERGRGRRGGGWERTTLHRRTSRVLGGLKWTTLMCGTRREQGPPARGQNMERWSRTAHKKRRDVTRHGRME